MYEEFYGFIAKPFHITPDLDFLFMSRKHRQAVSCMEYGLRGDAGIMLLTGEIGTGKTTLIRHIIVMLCNNIPIAAISNCNVDADELLGLILAEFGVDVRSDKKAGTIKAIEGHLHKLHEQDRRPLLIIDDAQNLSLKAMEDIRWLSNLQDRDRMLLQILLVGQPELKNKLANPALASLAQRIGISYDLQPFTAKETAEYIVHRLTKVNGRGDLFSDKAIELIQESTCGIPRSINLLCDNALVYGFADDLKIIDVATIRQVITEMGNSEIGFGRVTPLNNTAAQATGAVSPLPAGKVPAEAGSPQWREEMEARMKALEQMAGRYMSELHDIITTQLRNERKRNDKLILEYARLTAKNEMLQKSVDPPELAIDPSPCPVSDAGKPSQGRSNITQLANLQKK
jgi:general secretion pathway protein A